MGADAVEPLLLIGGEVVAGGEAREGEIDAFGGSEERVLVVGGVLDHGDDVAHGFLFAECVGALEILKSEALRRGFQLIEQLLEGVRGSSGADV